MSLSWMKAECNRSSGAHAGLPPVSSPCLIAVLNILHILDHPMKPTLHPGRVISYGLLMSAVLGATAYTGFLWIRSLPSR